MLLLRTKNILHLQMKDSFDIKNASIKEATEYLSNIVEYLVSPDVTNVMLGLDFIDYQLEEEYYGVLWIMFLEKLRDMYKEAIADEVWADEPNDRNIGIFSAYTTYPKYYSPDTVSYIFIYDLIEINVNALDIFKVQKAFEYHTHEMPNASIRVDAMSKEQTSTARLMFDLLNLTIFKKTSKSKL